MKVHCLFDELVAPESLKSHPKNRNEHTKEQIKRFAKILKYQGWRYAIKVSKQSGFVTTGHGRILSAIFNDWKEVPVVYQDYETPEQEYADVQADNAIASWATLDLNSIRLDLEHLDLNFDKECLGIEELFPSEAIHQEAEIIDDKVQFIVAIHCNSENEMQILYEEFRERGLFCKLIT